MPSAAAVAERFESAAAAAAAAAVGVHTCAVFAAVLVSGEAVCGARPLQAVAVTSCICESKGLKPVFLT
jgi:pyruvate kinase